MARLSTRRVFPGSRLLLLLCRPNLMAHRSLLVPRRHATSSPWVLARVRLRLRLLLLLGRRRLLSPVAPSVCRLGSVLEAARLLLISRSSSVRRLLLRRRGSRRRLVLSSSVCLRRRSARPRRSVLPRRLLRLLPATSPLLLLRSPLLPRRLLPRRLLPARALAASLGLGLPSLLPRLRPPLRSSLLLRHLLVRRLPDPSSRTQPRSARPSPRDGSRAPTLLSRTAT
mmetsp:Transcript_37684/g.91686  ORF Transcript_37684/g.91686 Transcript_37684/m.91686 type:complete len:227 (+) Transcript_37684:678-1358(+)